ncbi:MULTISPECIES: hypothetical protein [unclassified Rhodococcus (in: high G+C Gram-positive bacteria)]|uniref:hypothetical protein n=1 Tax=unclassified Rhodococcus (in: high G+C Gram-positive bacteria) TaxID=192944 RepID=UPI00163B4F42|nr:MULTISPECIES: hypothetical protein [unclassified Rhodococcus (in: high G+C Gram-positive bacteria)]MBC2638249.1 hypothetical protein [Rhodococcus sp. 3A]MBC2897009.1 hypothetical protein [Rhodococcus sp. 4CII]
MDERIVSVRQNLALIVDHAALVPGIDRATTISGGEVRRTSCNTPPRPHQGNRDLVYLAGNNMDLRTWPPHWLSFAALGPLPLGRRCRRYRRRPLASGRTNLLVPVPSEIPALLGAAIGTGAACTDTASAGDPIPPTMYLWAGTDLCFDAVATQEF